MPDPLSPSPPPVGATIEHDGVVWEIKPTPGHTLFLWGVVGAALASVGAALNTIDLIPVAVVTVLVALAVVAQHPRITRVDLGDRALTVEQVRLLRTQRTVLPLDKIEVARVSPPRNEGGTGSAVFRAGHDTVSIGAGRPPAELRWFVGAVEQARHHLARREGIEGREYSFLQRVPPEVDALRRG